MSNRNRTIISVLLACLLILIVQSCGPTPANEAELRVNGLGLPGRLLYARAGDVWMWQGDTAIQLTQQANLTQPALSPDGSLLAAVQVGPSYSDIVVLPGGGGEPQTLTDGNTSAPLNSFERAQSTTWSRYPVFAPDGRILYTSQAGPASGEPAVDYNMSLYETTPVIGGTRTQLYANNEGNIGTVAIGASGVVVMAFEPNSDAPSQLLSYRDGSTSQIEGVPDSSYDPAFTPDGAWLLFAARNATSTDIYAVPVGGGTAIRLTTQGSARAPAVSPDGKWLAFLALSPQSSSFDLHIAPLTITDSALSLGEVRQLTQGQQLDVDGGLMWGG